MGDSGLEFWNRHSLRFLEMAFQVDRQESLERPDGYGKKIRECGDTVEIFLIIHNGRIQNASFQTEGCLYSVACANAVVHMVEGKTIEEAHGIDPEDVVGFLETLPENELHCAELAIEALRAALSDARSRGPTT
jgi:nitrogen fixation NifU-like protein